MENEQIYEAGDYCEKCLGVENVGEFNLAPDFKLPLCAKCYEGKESLRTWFAEELRKALIESGEYEELPDGTFKNIGK